MGDTWKGLRTRTAGPADRQDILQLIQRKGFVHRHMGWDSPLDWLGRQPFILLEDHHQLAASLACPPDEDGITWLRLFVCKPGINPRKAWSSLWDSARTWLINNTTVGLVTSLVVNPDLEPLLLESGFVHAHQVIVLRLKMSDSRKPDLKPDPRVRRMMPEDLPAVYEINKQAFGWIWRNSLSQIQTAYQEASSATVLKLGQEIAAYQISTINPHGGHLARLAVAPAYQQQGLGTSLLARLVEDFQSIGIKEITVNTQADNHASLRLYHRFGFTRLADVYPVLQFRLSKTGRAGE